MAAAAPCYRTVERDVADAKSKFQSRYRCGVSATYSRRHRAGPIASAKVKMKSVADHAIRMEETETEEKTSVSSAQRVKQRNSRTSISSTTANFSNRYWTKQIESAKTTASEASIKSCPMCAGRHKIEQCTATECLFGERRTIAKGAHISISCSEAPSNQKGLKMAFDGKA